MFATSEGVDNNAMPATVHSQRQAKLLMPHGQSDSMKHMAVRMASRGL